MHKLGSTYNTFIKNSPLSFGLQCSSSDPFSRCLKNVLLQNPPQGSQFCGWDCYQTDCLWEEMCGQTMKKTILKQNDVSALTLQLL